MSGNHQQEREKRNSVFQDASNQSLPELGTCDNKDEAETSVLIYNLLQRKGDLVL